MQRTLGLILLAIGTGLAAVYGAWLPGGSRSDHRARMENAAHVAMAGVVAKAQDAAKAGQDTAEQARLDGLAATPVPVAPRGPGGKALTAPIGGASVSLWLDEAGLPFGAGILLVIIGVVLARRGIRAEANAAHADTAAAGGAPGPLLARLVTELAALRARHAGDSLDLEQVRADVEQLQKDVVTPLVEGRAQISQAFGVGPFADVFVPFSAAERQLNRVWSACVDGYVDEVRPCMERAQRSAEEADATYRQLIDARASGM